MCDETENQDLTEKPKTEQKTILDQPINLRKSPDIDAELIALKSLSVEIANHWVAEKSGVELVDEQRQ
jgi:hypothetical protein